MLGHSNMSQVFLEFFFTIVATFPQEWMAREGVMGYEAFRHKNPHIKILSRLIGTEVHNTVAALVSFQTQLLNGLASIRPEGKKSWRNLSLPPIGCKRKVQRTATLLRGAAEKARYSRGLQFVFILTSPLLFSKSTFCANIQPRRSRRYKDAKEM